jgi:RHS repeat-associated protein
MSLKIDYHRARFYSPYTNHFISPDTIVPSMLTPQTLNRYSYVANNPMLYTDPTGHSACENYGGTCLSENQVTQIGNNTPGSGGNSGGGGSSGGGGGGGTPTPSTTPAPQLPPTPSPQGTPYPSTTVVSTSVAQQTNSTYTEWWEAPYGDDGWDIEFGINPLFFLSSGALETNVNQGQNALQITMENQYSYITETTTTTTTTTTTIVDQYGNNMSSTSNTTTTSDITGIYQQEQITINPPGWTFTTIGGNMCGMMLPC